LAEVYAKYSWPLILNNRLLKLFSVFL
jgi:hypothetical protein